MTQRDGEERPTIDEHLARRLVDEQFPHWRHLPVTPVEVSGWDNRTFRLGDELTIRLPSAAGYSLQVDKEQQWLPILAPQLPLPIPTPVSQGNPGLGYPFSWSVYRWLDGETAGPGTIADLTQFATSLAEFLVALQGIDANGGPEAGPHNFFRGGPLATYEEEALRSIDVLGDEIPRDAALAVWDDATSSSWQGEPVWFHGDVAVGNLLVRDGRLSAVIDFGTSGVGDPACDVVIAWTLLAGRSRDAFRGSLGVDAATWSRGRGWALWKALITLVGLLESDPAAAAEPRRVIAEVLADHAQQL
ncbi:aminoglycoside phosphotransferase (APT) family kinase protein [Microlunatus panaciterrae]|uniref:Aminoglycoside phosphotransferase (APT) family kinase protein n=1 Tax=Microlunatus panaciterrae TaxID=400768 RepID=A0ABS2RJ86_9ACTN|nr:aminoglycoside phosphotransferase (APT) family kinase protein [Microlunatus panaciterrae]